MSVLSVSLLVQMPAVIRAFLQSYIRGMWSSEAGYFLSPSESPVWIMFWCQVKKTKYQVSCTLKFVAYVLFSSDMYSEVHSVQVACVHWFQVARLTLLFFPSSAFNLCPVRDNSVFLNCAKDFVCTALAEQDPRERVYSRRSCNTIVLQLK